MKSFREALRAGVQYLQGRGIEDAAVDAWLLLSYVTGWTRTRLLAEGAQAMTEADEARYEALLAKRGGHIPLQHLTGEQEFMGLSFRVNDKVLVPRQDTEVLVSEAMKHVRRGGRVLDLCTGSGCIAVSLALLAGADVDASDVSEEALAVARDNAVRLDACVRFIKSDLFEALDGRYEVIVSNPPYIRSAVIEELSEEVRCHEPHLALDGKEDGLYFYRKIIAGAGAHLAAGGWLLFEIGYDQAKQVTELMQRAGFTGIDTVRDLAGLDRVVAGRLPEIG